jgi:hypothetical protein
VSSAERKHYKTMVCLPTEIIPRQSGLLSARSAQSPEMEGLVPSGSITKLWYVGRQKSSRGNQVFLALARSSQSPEMECLVPSGRRPIRASVATVSFKLVITHISWVVISVQRGDSPKILQFLLFSAVVFLLTSSPCIVKVTVMHGYSTMHS